MGAGTSTPREEGRTAGRTIALNLVEDARRSRASLRSLVNALEAADTAGCESLANDGRSADDVAEWHRGFFEAGEAVVLAYHKEQGGAAPQAAPMPEPAPAPAPSHLLALGSQSKPSWTLRPEDFGILPPRRS